LNNLRLAATYYEVKLVKKTFVLALVAFWALVTNHCALEDIPGLGFLACATQVSEDVPHQPSGCGDDDACADVESGFYKSEESQVSAGKASVAPVAFVLALLSDLSALEPTASQISAEATPPELAHTWHFSFRTALPPRAPSFLS
jgi:hypothetical protein